MSQCRWRFGVTVSVVGHINEVAVRRARLVLGWVTSSTVIPCSLVSLPSHLGQLSLLPSVGRENEYRPRAVTFCGWGGNGRLWKRCGLPSITPGASPLPAQDHGTEMSSAPWRRIVCVCNYADQWVNLLFFNTGNSHRRLDATRRDTFNNCSSKTHSSRIVLLTLFSQTVSL